MCYQKPVELLEGVRVSETRLHRRQDNRIVLATRADGHRRKSLQKRPSATLGAERCSSAVPPDLYRRNGKDRRQDW
ncbi:hypothetical protein HDG40_006644 [Paraburkholderia sp. JPY158]|uniref:Uncharacterized protein n=1 Tax=Paraburkholderia atlantica TaxID=2654982 RepID=A0A7W8QDQ9_PARAM|nr:hypothetical protein [Paraburkholderia atlantica]